MKCHLIHRHPTTPARHLKLQTTTMPTPVPQQQSPVRISKKSSARVVPIPLDRSTHRQSSIRQLLSPFVLKNDNVEKQDIPVVATKAWVIRVACGQIVHALDDKSDTLSHQLLQELCAELVVRSTAVIQSKVDKSNKPLQEMEMENKDVDIFSSKKNATIEPNGALPNDEHRKAELVENEVNASRSFVKLLEEYPLAPFPDDESFRPYHALYNYLPNNQRLDYLAFKRSDANVPFILFFYLSVVFFVITGFFWSSNLTLYQQYPTAAISIIFAVLAAISLLWIGLNHVVSLSIRYKLFYFHWYNRYVVKLFKSSYGQWLDNCACLFAALASGFYLVNIVIMHLCHTTTDIHNNITCLPSSVPPEAIIMTMLIVVMVQIVARGVSGIALVCSWVICLAAVNTSIYLSGNSNYAWINLLLILIMGVSYELERQPLCQFIKTANAMEAVRVAAELQLQLSTYRTLVASDALESKRSLVSDVITNRFFFHSLRLFRGMLSSSFHNHYRHRHLFYTLDQVRHIGHEIRTPLNVVGVGVDMLIKELEPHLAVLPDSVMDVLEGIQEVS